MSARRGGAGWRRVLHGLWPRLFAFNCLLVFVPVAGLLFLDAHERAMLAEQERAMVGIGRVLAASLAAAPAFDPAAIERTLRALNRGTGARIRVLDPHGRVLADSSALGPRGGAPPAAGSPARDRSDESWLYRIAAAPVRFARGLRGGGSSLESAEVYAAAAAAGAPLDGHEVRAALAGRYGAAARLSAGGQRSLTLYSALPVVREDRVRGAVLVSQSTWRILGALHALRLEVARVGLASLAAAVALSLLLARTIARPLGRLRDEAERLLDRSGRLRGRFTACGRDDEIGALARSLEALRARLDERVGAMERFAVELDHELKNPLASVRNAAELLAESERADERRRLAAWIERDVARMQHILGGVREIGRRDAGREAEPGEPVDLVALLAAVAEGFRRRGGPEVRLRPPGPPARGHPGPWVAACPESLCQVLENLIENAASFGGDAGVDIEVEEAAGQVRVRVLDRGPGIPAAQLPRIFDRFFSQRPSTGPAAAGAHVGLGLSIARAIVEACGGRIEARNRPGGGACFEFSLGTATGGMGARSRPRDAAA
ncbi:MAG: stimulus-sensing domain-containing protein [Myxococcota bacterium]